jgi:hypothetical protein
MADPSRHEEPSVEELRAEQREEASRTSYVHTPGQVHGALLGGLAFGLVGLVVGVLIGLFAFDADSPARVVVPIVVTVFAAWVGVVFWGGRGPEIERETTTIYGEPQDGSSDRAPEPPGPAT